MILLLVSEGTCIKESLFWSDWVLKSHVFNKTCVNLVNNIFEFKNVNIINSEILEVPYWQVGYK